ncbi:MAG: carboxypeptidase-like regulatory domain-containing protein [Lewinella sp.]|nr:carboxypeptidase-like regulatory domain-containing protein [Lewinella sp.]
MIRSLFWLGFFLAQGLLVAQTVEGTVQDQQTGEPLVFVNISLGHSQQGTITDMDGRFSLTAAAGDTLRFSYVGYEDQEIVLKGQLALQVRLAPMAVELATVVVRPGENPAWRIIRATVANRGQHDPGQLAGYQYRAYHKTVFTIDSVSDPTPLDPATADDPVEARTDSLLQAAFLNDMHLWLTETVTENYFRRPNQRKEYVLASRSSIPNDLTGGFNPIDFQPFGFYQEIIRLDFANRDYLNPISRGTFDRYYFALADTLYQGPDTTFIIRYQPLPGKNFFGLQGLLYINSDGYAIENVIAEPADTLQLLGFRIQQQARRVDGRWFPQQLQTDLSFRIQMGGEYTGYAFRNRSEIDEVSFSPPPADHFNHYFRESGPAPAAVDWDSLRTLPLDQREANTYIWWDTLPELRSTYRFLKAYTGVLLAVSSGWWTAGPVDIVLPDLFRNNRYEKVRLGLGLRTSPALIRWGHLYAYAGYGFGDRAWKYGGALEVKLYEARDLRLGLSYANDLAEPGITTLLTAANNPWAGLNARNAARVLMDQIEETRVDLYYRPWPRVQLNPYYSREHRQPTYDYTFLGNEQSWTRFRQESLGLRLRWAPREQLVKMGRLETLLREVWPVVEFAASRNWAPDQSLDYFRLTGQLTHRLRTKVLGATEVRLQAGWLSEQAPYAWLFNAPGGRTPGNGAVNTAFTFQTMGLNEFVADRFVYLFLEHGFGRLLGRLNTRYSQPELSLVQYGGWSRLTEPSVHEGLVLQGFPAGYWESGVQLDNLLCVPYFQTFYLGLGVGVRYRWGYYHLPEWRDNLRWTLNLTMAI